MTTHESTPTSSSGITRRRLVKTGAHAAWVVPTVAVVASAPAYADSARARLTVSNLTATRTTTQIQVNADITNEPGVNADGVTLSITFGEAVTYVSSNNSDFGASNQSGSSDVHTFTLVKGGGTLTGDSTNPGGATGAFDGLFTGSGVATSVALVPATTTGVGVAGTTSTQ